MNPAPYDMGRLLASRDTTIAFDYEVVAATGPDPVLKFHTGSVNGKSPDDTAIGNLLDFSEYHDGVFALRRRGGKTFCYAHGGVGWNAEGRDA